MNSYKPIEVSQKQRLCGRFTRRQCYIIIGVPVILLSITGIVLLALHLSGTIGYQNHNSASITDMSADDLLSCGNLDPFGDASKMTTYSFDPKLTKAFLFNVVGQGAVTGRIKIFQSATDDPTGMQPANLTVRLVSTDPLARIDGGQDGINFNLQVQSKETFIPPSMFTTSSSSSVIPTSSAGVNATRAANATGPVMPYGCSRFDIELVLPRITTMSVWNFTAPDARVELVASFVNVNGTGKIVVTDRVVVQMLAGDVTMNDIIAPTVKIEIKNGTILGIFHDVRNFTTSTQNGDVDVNLRGNYLAQANITASTGNGNVTVRLQPISGTSSLGMNTLFDLSTTWAFNAAGKPQVEMTNEGARYESVRITTNAAAHMAGSIMPIPGVAFPYQQLVAFTSMVNVSAAGGDAVIVVD